MLQLFHASGQIAPELIELLRLTNVEHNGTIADIVAQTQALWLRAPNIESWQMPDKIFANHHKIIEQLRALHFFNAVAPIQKEYQHLILLGTTFKDMILRIEYTISLWTAGTTFQKIHILTGARPAAPEEQETISELEAFTGNSITTATALVEADFVRAIYQHSQLPEQMRAIPVQIIDVPMLTKKDGSLRRPTTADTIEYWLKTDPQPGTVLAISNQPYVQYQHSVLQILLPASYPVETVGTMSSENIKIGVLLDTFARLLYQEKQRLNL